MAVALNPETVAPTPYDNMGESTVASFYATVDEAIQASDVVKGQYKYSINPAYNAPNPVDSNSYTTIGLTFPGPQVVSLNESYIQTVIHLQMVLDTPFEQDCMTTDTFRQGIDQVWFIGWKSSIDCIQRYDIMVNSTPVYTQSFCGEESFIQYQTLTDLVKHSTPYIYTSFKNASQMSPCVCGTYVIIKGQNLEANTHTLIRNINCEIPVKIPITNFLILRDIKYLMSWMGKWEIRLFFSPQNLVILPIHPKVVDKFWTSFVEHNDIGVNVNCGQSFIQKVIPTDIAVVSGTTSDGKYTKPANWYDGNGCAGKLTGAISQPMRDQLPGIPEVKGWLHEAVQSSPVHRFRGHERFIQFGDEIPMLLSGKGLEESGHTKDGKHYLKSRGEVGGGSLAKPEYPRWGVVRLSLKKMQMSDCEIVAANFQIRMDVLEMLKHKYLSEKPLTFPVSTLQVSRFTGLPTMGQKVPKGGGHPFTMVLCQAINNVDTLFILPYGTHFQHTVCYQPWVKNFQLQAGPFGSFPIQPINTFQEYDTRTNHMRFNQWTQDCLNICGSHLVGFNQDLCYEYCPRLYLTNCELDVSNPPTDKGALEFTGYDVYEGEYKQGDDSNFFISIPFGVEGDFQGGMSSPVSNINFKVMGSFYPPKEMIFSTPWVGAFLIDGVIMIRPDPMSDSAKVIWSDRTVI